MKSLIEKATRNGTPTALEVPTVDELKARPSTTGILELKHPDTMFAEFTIRGSAPLVINAFPKKVMEGMIADQMLGSVAKKSRKKVHEPKNFAELYESARHRLKDDGGDGFPACGLRQALIDACRVTEIDIKMVQAKMTVFVVEDGYDDAFEGYGLVKITKGMPRMVTHPVRLPTGVFDIRCRALWDPGWEAKPRLLWNKKQFTLKSVTNLLNLAGSFVGLCEGRPFSRNSAGCGWGTFTVAGIEHNDA